MLIHTLRFIGSSKDRTLDNIEYNQLLVQIVPGNVRLPLKKDTLQVLLQHPGLAVMVFYCYLVPVRCQYQFSFFQ
jgi:hypothetical protein